MAGIHGVRTELGGTPLGTFEFREEINRDWRGVRELRNSPKGREQYAERNPKGYKKWNKRSSVPATARRFVVWDGEGYTAPDESHHYVLFGNSDGDSVQGSSLSTAECLDCIGSGDADAIHVGFAFGYDVNMILRDLSRGHLRALREQGWVKWRKWRLQYLPRKWFVVTDLDTRKSVKIWDVWSFFMCSFVKACKQYGVELTDLVKEGKASRSEFRLEELETVIKPYWNEENQKAVELVGKLREALYSADLYITQWHGPGAIASFSMAAHKVDAAKCVPPNEVNEAAQYAYGGGRFELFRIGRANTKVYEYDINSAYPFAISKLPDLTKGEWTRVLQPRKIARFGVYRISYAVNAYDPSYNVFRAHPYFARDSRGQISFPCVVETWVWSPELWGTHNIPGLTIHEGWEFVESSDARPFAWIAESYEKRREYKRAGNAAQLALKLQMNSMYGKMAQRVGWNEERREPPKWHQLEWAGWVVSYCRAMVYQASRMVGPDLVAFETDAVFSTRPIQPGQGIVFGSGLGDWEATTYDDFVYLQSGCRFGLNPTSEGEVTFNGWQSKYRGFDAGSITVDMALEALGRNPDQWSVQGTTTRFVGFAQALHTDFAKWRRFERTNRELSIGKEGKRRHYPAICRACNAGASGTQGFHDLTLANPAIGQSHKHFLPWKDGELLEPQRMSDEEKWDANYG